MSHSLVGRNPNTPLIDGRAAHRAGVCFGESEDRGEPKPQGTLPSGRSLGDNLERVAGLLAARKRHGSARLKRIVKPSDDQVAVSVVLLVRFAEQGSAGHEIRSSVGDRNLPCLVDVVSLFGGTIGIEDVVVDEFRGPGQCDRIRCGAQLDLYVIEQRKLDHDSDQRHDGKQHDDCQ